MSTKLEQLETAGNQSTMSRLLIVDDNVALARVTQFAFDKAGFDTKTACNGAVALELARNESFDMVITDQQMPVMSGTELCRELRVIEEYAQTPIVMLTAKGLELELDQLREELDIQAIFPKPFSPSSIVEAVQKMLAVAV
ncbi:MAG: response regulator [Lacipirellulaceae bacterium]